MRKIVIAKALVLTIFGSCLAVMLVEPPNAKSDAARSATPRIVAAKWPGQFWCNNAFGRG